MAKNERCVVILYTQYCPCCGAYLGQFDYAHEDIPDTCIDCAEENDPEEDEE